VLAALLLALAAGGCMERGNLFGPDPVAGANAPSVRLDSTSYVLFEGDQVAVRVEGLDGRTARAELFASGAGGEVVWRSGQVVVADSVAWVPVAGLTPGLIGDTLLALGATVDVAGMRVYAGADSVPVVERAKAVLRPVRFYPGTLLGVAAGRAQSLALDPVSGRLFFAASDRARIGVLDLAAGREVAGTDVPTGPVALRYARGQLGALVSGGTELEVYDAATLALRQRTLLPTLRLEIQTLKALGDSATPMQVDTFAAAVRPYARDLAWGCPDDACASPLVAFSASGLAASANQAAHGVVRRTATGAAPVVPLLVPAYAAGAVESDTLPSRVRILAARSSGADSVLFDRPDRLRCPTAELGGGAFDVATAGAAVLYAAVDEDLACGAGTRLMRIDAAASADPAFSAPARRNLLGEDRVGAVSQLRVSPDGLLVLVRSDGQVHVFDRELRLRGSVDVQGSTAIAWVEGSTPGSSHFAVASADGVVVYEAARRTAVTRLPLGPTQAGLLSVWRTGGELVVVAAPQGRGGLVIARVPFP